MKHILFLLCWLSSLLSFAQSPLEVSLLTVSPGSEVYEVYGHTALRIKDTTQSRDWVFNYGLFDFDAPHFLMRFVKGETDYLLGVTTYDRFAFGYEARGAQVVEQMLNLTSTQAQNLLKALLENAKPENRVYRYNFFFDNCATRPRDMVLAQLPKGVNYETPIPNHTFRQWSYEMTQDFPWLTFGVDLALGAKADQEASYDQAMFLPSNLEEAFQGAHIKESGTSLVTQRKTIIGEDQQAATSTNSIQITPLLVSCLLFLLVLGYSYYDWKRGHYSHWINVIFFTLSGFSGVILFYLNFFSVHPCVDHNYNCFWLQPLHLIVGLLFWVNYFKKGIIYYHFANFVVIILLVSASYFIPQVFNLSFYPLMGILGVRSGFALMHTYLNQAYQFK